MAAQENTTCHTIYMCACVCARVSINTEIAPFSGFLLSHYVHIPGCSDFFVMWDYFSIFMRAGDVVACGASDRAI